MKQSCTIPPFLQQYTMPDGKVVQVEINLDMIVTCMGPRACESRGGISRDGFVVVRDVDVRRLPAKP